MPDFIHPFEICGLGTYPFKFSHFKKMIHYSFYQIDGTPDPFSEKRAGGTCEYCGHIIKDGYFFNHMKESLYKIKRRLGSTKA